MNTRKDRESPPIPPPPPEPLFLLPQSCEQFLAFPTVPLRGLAGRCFYISCQRCACRPPDICCSEEIEKRLAAPLVGEQLPRSWCGPCPGSFLVSFKTVAQGVFCWLFHCGQFLDRCSRVRILYWAPPPTAGVRASSGPRKVLSCQAVPRLGPVEAGGKALVCMRHRRIRLLLFAGADPGGCN